MKRTFKANKEAFFIIFNSTQDGLLWGCSPIMGGGSGGGGVKRLPSLKFVTYILQ